MSTTDPFEGVPAPLRTAMERRGFTALTAVQSAVVGADVAGRNLRITSQTGSGKTIAIGLVLAETLAVDSPQGKEDGQGKEAGRKKKGGATRRSPRALIIAPTRELAVQVQSELAWLFEHQPKLGFAVVTGGSDLRRERLALSRGPAVVVGTPGRLLDHIRTGALNPSDMDQVILDEADRMLEMGFREELDAIFEALPKKRRSHLVSATFGAAVRNLANQFQEDPVHLQGTTLGAANENIEHTAHLINPSDRYAALVNTLLVNQGSRCLVFVERRMETAEIADRLAKDGFSALPFSGELAQAQRTRTLAAFRNGSVDILIATDVAARGIDVPDIGMVIQTTVPTDPDTYTHRSGRTGRAGRKGHSVLLVPASAEKRIRRLLAGAKIKANWSAVPGPDQVRKLSRKSMRRNLYNVLDGEQQLTEQQLEYAASLIEDRDPAQVIATLLEMAKPATIREPMTIGPVNASAKRSQGNSSRPQDRRDFVPFLINWGQKAGATTPRLLSHVCRRGEITSRDVGIIRMGPSTSRFEVSRKMAEIFERKVAKPDSRDPSIRIKRDTSTGPSSPQARPAHSPRKPSNYSSRNASRSSSRNKTTANNKHAHRRAQGSESPRVHAEKG